MTDACRYTPRFAVAVSLAVASFGTVGADTVAPKTDAHCAGGRVKAVDVAPPQATEICRAAADVTAYFAALGFRIKASTSLTVRFRPVAGGEHGRRTHGYFHPASRTIVVFRSPDAAPWGLAWHSSVETSFVRHELVHAAVSDILSADTARLRPEWHEFIAYAIQIDLMEASLRDRVLGRYRDAEAYADLMGVNEFTYGTEPERFAVSAYRTYLARGGRQFIKALLTFQIVPPATSYPFPVLPDQLPGLAPAPPSGSP